MTKIERNFVFHGLSGMLGRQVVCRQLDSERQLVAAPDAVRDTLSAFQRHHQKRFLEAILYHQGLPSRYRSLNAAACEAPVRNFVIVYFLHPPEIEQIDVSAYRGRPNEDITIIAASGTQPETVGVMIVNDNGTLVETGKATSTDATRWHYRTTAAIVSTAVKIVVDVADVGSQVTDPIAWI